MATISITVNEDYSSLVVYTITNEMSNSCKTIWTITSNKYANDIGDTFHVSVDSVIGPYVLTCNDPNYVFNTNYVSTLNNVWTVEIENSGSPGVYNTITLTINNVTKAPAGESTILTRYNDGAIC